MQKKILCKRCGYSWLPRKPIDEIIICPKCKSPYWNKSRKKGGMEKNDD